MGIFCLRKNIKLLFLKLICGLFTVSCIQASIGQADDFTPVCGTADSLLKPHLIVTTKQGIIDIELYERAAPNTIRRLIDLVKGPIYNQKLAKAGHEISSVGYYDGLTFNFIRPHLEIASSERAPASLFQIEPEIDADALGLDREIIENSAEAMNVMQTEILVVHRKTKKKGTATAQLSLWMEKWKKAYNPDFLIGVSKKEINAAQGYIYKTGLDSKPVTRGAVVLKPVAPHIASTRLSIILQDMPNQTGKWMVIGRVIEGLDLADTISIQPQVTPRHVKPRVHAPLNPTVIDSIKFSCR